MSRKHWSEQYACHVGGKRHRPYHEDAKHRHSFAAMCKVKKLKKKVDKNVDSHPNAS